MSIRDSVKDDPTLTEVQAAITFHASQAARYGPYWHISGWGIEHNDTPYVWAHQQINDLLDERDRILNHMASEAIIRSSRNKALRFLGIKGL